MSFEILISWAIEKWSEVLLYVIWNPRKQQNHSVDSFTGHPVNLRRGSFEVSGLCIADAATKQLIHQQELDNQL